MAFDPNGMAAPLGPALVVPLRSGDQLYGVLSVARRDGAADYDEEEVPLAAAFAEQGGAGAARLTGPCSTNWNWSPNGNASPGICTMMSSNGCSRSAWR